jgi:hypothetical protein
MQEEISKLRRGGLGQGGGGGGGGNVRKTLFKSKRVFF